MSRKKLISVAIILALVIAIGGILAYFTDVKTKTNKFKMGTIEIIVDEGDFPEEGEPDVVPGAEFVKSPKVINVGTIPVYAFVEVTIPYDTVRIGEETTAIERDLFEMVHNVTEGGNTTTVPGINAGWKSVNFEGSVETSTGSGIYVKKTHQAATATEPEDTTRGVATYVFAYVGNGTTLKALEGKANDEAEKGEETNTLFDKVRFIDVTETTPVDSKIQGQIFNVIVSGYGIQTTELGLEGAAATDPDQVWPLVKR